MPVTGADDDPECSGDTTCDAAGACRRKDGRPCAEAAACASGVCKDGACCEAACDGPCQDCTTGACVPVTGADDDPECQGDTTCDDSGRCVPAGGAPWKTQRR